MTSGTFASVEIASITVAEDRQRRSLEGVEDLAASIARNGLINPITITRSGLLVAGATRLEACRLLGWTAISVQYAEDLPRDELEILELEENLKRRALSWQDHTAAIVRYHELARKRNPEQTTAETAEALGMTSVALAQHLLVKREIDLGVEQVQKAEGFSTALNLTRRRVERRREDSLNNLIPTAEPSEEPLLLARPIELIHGNFLEWAYSYSGPRFNFIHFDPPYGINYDKMPGQHTVHDTEVYADTPDIYFQLLRGLLESPQVLADQCHMILWFAMDHFAPTLDLLSSFGWRVDKRPLIWLHSDNAGILPDPNRGPRWIYDTALFCTRGDRKIVGAVANAVAAATTREFHSSEKPLAVLDHFFRMVVDESTRMLDPTCGSAMSLRAAEARGAKHALGIEIMEENYANACRNLGFDGGASTGA
jgi:16S rRNA G966 N2-methylase RsmD